MGDDASDWTRRRFLTITGAAAVGTCVCGCAPGGNVDVLHSDLTVAIADHPELMTTGRTALVDAGLLSPLAVTRMSTSTFLVTGTECNHQHCSVQRAGSGWVCPCHGSQFALDGTLERGPATAGLALYDSTFDGTTLTIHGM